MTTQKIALIDESDVKDCQKYYSDSFIEYKNAIRLYSKVPYFENPKNPRFLGYMKEKIESVLNIAERIPKSNREIDFILNIWSRTFKVKHIISCCHYYFDNVGNYSYFINHNKAASAFLLSAYDRDSLELLHLWFIPKTNRVRNTNGRTQIMRKRVWFRVISSPEMIKYMDRFELNPALKKLRELNLHKFNNNGKFVDLTTSLLFDKQREIFDITGKKRSIEYLIENAIKSGFGSTLNLSILDIRQKLLNEKLRKEKDKIMKIRQEEYDNDAYHLVLEKQKQLFEITKEMKSIKEIIDEGVETGIDYIIE